MITEHDLKEAIAECEGQRNPSSTTCMKLAAFYTIRDKMYPAKQEEAHEPIVPSYSYSSKPIESDTEFMQVVKQVDHDKFIETIDELMTTLQAIMPKLYNGVIRKLTQD